MEIYYFLLLQLLIAGSAKPRSRTRNFHPSTESIEVAVCFVGQFIRHQMMEGDVRSKFGTESSAVTYSAFVASSTQHEEVDPSGTVNGDEICSALADHGFKTCDISLEAYNPEVFSEHIRGLEFQSEIGIFPFRSASFFSTISRCINLIEATENSTQKQFDAIVVTRLDVMNGISVLNPSSLWWRRALAHDIVGAKKVRGLLDDRFFLGKREVMVKFRDVYNRFKSLYSPKTNSPERMLFSFAHLTTPNLRLAPIYEFIVFQEFEVNYVKYTPKFKGYLQDQLGMPVSGEVKSKADRKKACAHIHSPLAHNKCLEFD